MRQWRLIDDSPAFGTRNMAVDEAILQSVTDRRVLPTLRLYRWNPPCLSLGYGQKIADVDFERAKALGWDVVRRPTGGRAILHTDELTYSLSLPIDDDLAAGTVIDSYRRISTALIAGLSHLGIQLGADRRTEPFTVVGPVCFEIPSHYEITVAGRKLVGSAQLRRQAGILQHGSLPLSGDLTRICDVLAYSDEVTRISAKNVVHDRAITLSDALGVDVTYEAAAHVIVQGFAETFAVDFTHDSLTPEEQSHADQLTVDVYANPAWTHHR